MPRAILANGDEVAFGRREARQKNLRSLCGRERRIEVGRSVVSRLDG